MAAAVAAGAAAAPAVTSLHTARGNNNGDCTHYS